MDLGLCDCSSGMLRGPCKHNQIVATHFNLISSDLISPCSCLSSLFSDRKNDTTSARKGRKKVREQFQSQKLQNHVDCINVEVAKVPGKADLKKM